MSLCCVYHKSRPFRVVEDELADQLVATGEWFKHPNDVLVKEDSKNEKQIRQQPRKRCGNGEHPSKADGK